MSLSRSLWPTVPLGSVLKVKNGRNQREVEVPFGRYPILATGGEIGRTNTPLYSKPSVLIGRKGTINRPQFQATPFWTVDTLFYTEVSARADARYLYYLCTTIDWMSLSEATGVPSLTGKRIESVAIVLPDLDEQRRISELLIDADNLIASLERLIAKKRDVKQGLIQSVVQTWGSRMVSLREIGLAVRGVSYDPESDLEQNRTPDTVELLRANTVQGTSLYLKDVQHVHRRRVRGDQYLRRGDILVCAANGSKQLVGKAASIVDVRDEGRTFGAFMMVYRPSKKTSDPRFVALLFQTKSYRDWIEVLLAGSSINNLRPGDLLDFRIPLPDLEEQERVALLFQDFDAEITALERRLESTRALKQGMMQELLTGRTRLLAEVAA